MNKFVGTGAFMAAISVGAVVPMALAAPARADQYDFVAQLDDRGVYYSSISDVIDTGKMTCRLLRGGAGVPAAMNFVARDGYASYETAIIVVAAAQNMCPDVMPVLNAYVNAGPVTGAYGVDLGRTRSLRRQRSTAVYTASQRICSADRSQDVEMSAVESGDGAGAVLACQYDVRGVGHVNLLIAVLRGDGEGRFQFRNAKVGRGPMLRPREPEGANSPSMASVAALWVGSFESKYASNALVSRSPRAEALQQVIHMVRQWLRPREEASAWPRFLRRHPRPDRLPDDFSLGHSALLRGPFDCCLEVVRQVDGRLLHICKVRPVAPYVLSVRSARPWSAIEPRDQRKCRSTRWITTFSLISAR